MGGEALATQNIINQRLGQKMELWLQVQLPLPFPGPQPEWGGESFSKLTLREKVSGPSLFLHLIPELALAPEGQGQRAFPSPVPAQSSLSPSHPSVGCGRKKNTKEVARDTSSCSPRFCFMPLPHGSEDLLIPSWDCPKYYLGGDCPKYHFWGGLPKVPQLIQWHLSCRDPDAKS